MVWRVKTMLPLSRAAVSVASFWILVATESVSASDGGMLEDARPSVLLINVDDWNDWNQVLRGHPQAITPNIERLAKKGVTFSNTICASPVCFPSRTALFSGIHPARSGCISNFNWRNSWRTYVPDAVTLPRHLAHHGWQTIGIAKQLTGETELYKLADDPHEFNNLAQNTEYAPGHRASVEASDVPLSGNPARRLDRGRGHSEPDLCRLWPPRQLSLPASSTGCFRRAGGRRRPPCR